MTYVPAREPWAHQAEALERLERKPDYALFMAMRTGKSYVTLNDYGRLEDNGQVVNLMIIAPAAVYEIWAREAQKELSTDLRQRLLTHVWRSSSSVKAQRDRAAFLAVKDRPRMLVMNVEALSSVKDARSMAKAFLKSARTYLAIDESTVIKNPSAKRTRFIIKELAPLAEVRRILSGLPSPRSPLDIYSQFEFLNPRILGFKSFYAFRARYAQMRRVRFGGREIPLIVGYQNTEELRRKIAPFSFRKRLEDCYDLPPKIYTQRAVMLTAEQRRLYDELKRYATAQLASSDHVSATLVITQILRLHQILCGHATDERGQVHGVPENRTDALLQCLNEHDGKAVIWCSYDYDVQRVSQRLIAEFGEGCVARFWGGNRAQRESDESRFLSDPACLFMVATPAAGGRGRTWLVADLVVYFSNTNDLEHRAQSEERAQGVGKTKSVLYVDLIAPGTVDEKMVQALRAKIDMATTITGDNYQEWLI